MAIDPVTQITMKAKRYSPRDEETIDLAHFDRIEIRRGHRRYSLFIEDDHLVISGDDALIIQPRAGNRLHLPL